MHIGRTTAALASKDDLDPEERERIRSGLAPVVASMTHDLELVAAALTGPDPEYALSLFLDVLHDAPAALRRLDAALAGPRSLRAVA